MHDARDAEDTRLLEAGEFSLLVESYYGVMLDRCRARVWPEADAIAVAAEIAIRLLSELKRGRRYRVPFRVVVHKVIGWKIKEHFEPGKWREVDLDEWLDRAAGESPQIERTRFAHVRSSMLSSVSRMSSTSDPNSSVSLVQMSKTPACRRSRLTRARCGRSPWHCA